MDANQITCTPDRDLKTIIEATVEVCKELWAIDISQIKYTDGQSFCTMHTGRDESYWLVFGLPCVRNMMRGGTHHHPNVRGLNAVVTVATHEYVHAIQTAFGMRYDGSVHNQEFYDLFNRTYPQVVRKLTLKGYGKWTVN